METKDLQVLVSIGVAVLSVLTAYLNRKRIVVLRHETATSPLTGERRKPVTFLKRLKRFCICIGLAILFPVLHQATGAAKETEPAARDAVLQLFMWPFLICLFMAAYQFVAMIILIFARMWR